MPTYARTDLSFDRGEGVYLYGSDGRRYMDFMGGIAVSALGHSHPKLVNALTEQAKRVWHVSNIFRIPEGERLAKRLTDATFADTVFFTNSGAEAMECGIKLVRKYHSHNGHPERYRIITFEGAFHGRTLATIAAGGQKKHLDGFGPKVDGFDQVPFGDHKALEAAIGPATAAILIEPIQGEGGIRPVPTQCLRGLRELCDKHGLLLFFDEIQTGMGRTGRLFAHEWAGVTPDVMTIAKAIGGGFPLGACLATAKAAAGMVAGTHGSTYGGNPLAMACGNAVLDVMLQPGFFDHVQQVASHLKQQLEGIVARHPDVFEEVRGQGMILGLKCKLPQNDVGNALRAHGLLTVNAGDNVVRLLPPLIATAKEIAEGCAIVEAAATELSQKSRKTG
ncbi:MAG: aspartate aminotransferase family protein [Alphaproteobacteria bacterium]|nr:aspartate aminotransferase family protein [Alphaproteobacteria bacterium]